MKFTGTIASELSGSLGGITASRNRGGGYFRQKVIPTNPNTARQSVVRTLIQDLNAHWTSTLTIAQRVLWTAYSDATPGLVGGGLTAYVRNNLPRMNADTILGTALGRIDDAPTIFDSGSFSPVSLSTTAPSSVSIAYDNTDVWANATGGALLIYAGAPINVSRSNYFGRYHLIGAVIGDDSTPPTSPEVATSDLVFATGQLIYARVTACQADSRYSAAQRMDDVAA